VGFFSQLWTEAVASHTPYLLLLVAVAFVLSKLVALDQPRFKAMFFFIAAHLVGLVTTAAFVVTGSNLDDLSRTPTWIFGAVGIGGAAATLLFSVVLPRMRRPAPLMGQDGVGGMG